MQSKPRATSFIVLTGPKGTRRVTIVSGKTRRGTEQVTVDFSAFMVAYNAVMGAGQFEVTLAGIPCKFKANGSVVTVTAKRKATHGVNYGVIGRVKYPRSFKANNY